MTTSTRRSARRRRCFGRARYAVQKIGAKKAAVVYINNDTGIVAAQVYRDSFTEAGGEVVAYEAYDPKATDFTGAILKVRAAQPDMIHLHGLIADMPQVLAQMRQLGLNQPVSSYSAIYNPKVIEQLGKAAEGIIATSLAPGVSDLPLLARMSHAGRRRLAASRMDCLHAYCMTRRI